MFKLFFALTIFFNFTVYASQYEGRLVRKQGDADLLVSPSKSINKNGKSVLYEGLYYNLKKARLGMKVRNGNILRTKKGTKIRIVFRNGDQINIGEATSLKIAWNNERKSKNKDSTINLIYGKFRAVIDKEGPRSGSKVKTKHAVMGIRGTDFSVDQKGTSGKSSISVIRGSVRFKDLKKPKRILNVEQGFSAELNKSSKKDQNVLLAKTTKSELIDIHEQSSIDKEKEDKAKNNSLQKELKALEEKAAESSLKDIKRYEPKLYNKLKKNNINDIEEINKIAVGEVFVKAPKKKKKLSVDDIELDDDAYNKYFKVDGI